MEDHSLSGYLERRSTEELEAILDHCLQKPPCESNQQAIFEILRILNARVSPEAFAKLQEQVGCIFPPHQ